MIYIHTNWSLVHIALLVPTISPLFNHHLFETLDPTRSGPHLSRYPPWPETSVFPPWFLAYLRWPNLLGKSKSFAGGLARRLVKHCKGENQNQLQGSKVGFRIAFGGMMEKFGKKNLRVAWFLIYEWGLTTDFKLPRDFFWKLSPKRKNLRPHESHESTGCGL